LVPGSDPRLREPGIDTCFSVGVAITETIRQAIRAATGWIPMVDNDGAACTTAPKSARSLAW
jgi:hypothetical protein